MIWFWQQAKLGDGERHLENRCNNSGEGIVMVA